MLTLVKLVDQLTASAFDRLDQYTSNPDHRAHSHAELAVSLPAVAEAISNTYSAGTLRDSQAELACFCGYAVKCSLCLNGYRQEVC